MVSKCLNPVNRHPLMGESEPPARIHPPFKSLRLRCLIFAASLCFFGLVDHTVARCWQNVLLISVLHIVSSLDRSCQQMGKRMETQVCESAKYMSHLLAPKQKRAGAKKLKLELKEFESKRGFATKRKRTWNHSPVASNGWELSLFFNGHSKCHKYQRDHMGEASENKVDTYGCLEAALPGYVEILVTAVWPSIKLRRMGT